MAEKDDRNCEELSIGKEVVVEVEKAVEIYLEEEEKSQSALEDALAKDVLSEIGNEKKKKKTMSGPYLECRNRKRTRTLDDETESLLTDRMQSLTWESDDQVGKKPEAKRSKPEMIIMAPKCVTKSTGGFCLNKKFRKSNKLSTDKKIEKGSDKSSTTNEKRNTINNEKPDSSKAEEVLVFAKKSPPPIVKSPDRSKPRMGRPKPLLPSPDNKELPFTTPRRPGPASKTGKTPSPPMSSSKKKASGNVVGLRKYHYSPHTITGKVLPR